MKFTTSRTFIIIKFLRIGADSLACKRLHLDEGATAFFGFSAIRAISTGRNGAIELCDSFHEHQRNGLPAVENLRIIADERKQNHRFSADTYHFRMPDFKGLTARHVDAEWPK